MSDAADFIREKVEADTRDGTFGGRVQTRFPPEPNGYLHIGHAKAICLNFGIAEEFEGTCNLRFDDTTPTTENEDFVRSIESDIEWLGFTPSNEPFYASDYFEQLYEWAQLLIRQGNAYVDDQDAETISDQRGGFTEPGTNSPFRTRSVDENLDLFARMRAGDFDDGARVLRAKIDMAHENMQMRDPVLYRIRREHHFRTGTDWVIFPTYDWAHGQSDAIEGVTHSLCTLEFDSHRPLYDWCLDQLEIPRDRRPGQTEFARLNLTHTVLSKRKLAQLVEQGLVDGWDDARMPTLRGLRRRGYPAASIRAFCSHIGVARVNGTHEVELLESFVRTELNKTALRRAAVLRPLKVVITNWPEGQVEMREAVNNPEDEAAGTREVPFSGTLYIEQDDFELEPPKKYKRLSPGAMVRLRYGYIIECDEVITDDAGKPIELRCRYFADSKSGSDTSGLKPKGVVHWVHAQDCVPIEVNLYDRLFQDPAPTADNFLEAINPNSVQRVEGFAEPAMVAADAAHFQFERTGYFFKNPLQTHSFNRTVSLRDSWKPKTGR